MEVTPEELRRRIGQVRVLIQNAVRDLRSAYRQYQRWRDGRQRGGPPRGWARLANCLGTSSRRARCTSAAKEREKDAALVERAVSLSDTEIARLLRANAYDPQVACDRALQQLFWRRDHGVDALLGSSAEFEAQDRRGSLYWAGTDLEGRPVLTVCLRRHDPQLFSAETTLRFVLWKLEVKLADHNIEDITLLLDLENASRHNLDSKLLRELIPLLYNFYSGRLARVLFYPDSAISQSVWRAWSYLLYQDTVRKVSFIADCSQPEQESFPFNIASWLTAPRVAEGRDGEGNQIHNGFDDFIAPEQREERFGGSLQVSWSDVLSNFDDDFGLLPAKQKQKRRLKAMGGEAEFEQFLASQDSRLDNLVRSASSRSAASSGSSASSGSDSGAEDDGHDDQGTAASPRRRYRRPGNFVRRNTDLSMRSRRTRNKRATARGGDSHSPSQGGPASTEQVPPEQDVVKGESVSNKRAFGSGTTSCDASEPLEDPSLVNHYSEIPGSTFNLRVGPNYKRNKRKATAGPAIYELVAMDCAGTDRKVFHIAERLDLPPMPPSSVENCSGLPEMLIVNYQAPMYEPALIGREKTDGKSSGMGGVFRLSDWARENPDHVSVQMFRRFVNCFDGDPYRERLKCIASIVNPDEMNFSRMERAMYNRYNATPWLVRPEYRFFHGPGYFEIDVDIHIFNKFSRKIGWMVSKRLDQAIIDGALVIQAETDDEMPELPLCCWRMSRFHLNHPPCHDEVDLAAADTATAAATTGDPVHALPEIPAL